MVVVKVQKIPKKIQKAEDILASFCYNFPRYSLAQARKMPYKRINQMLKVARKEHARKMVDLLRIVAAPHSPKGKDVTKLLQEFNDILNS